MRTIARLLIFVLVGGVPAFAESGKAIIRGTTEGSSVSGTATFTETPGGLKITVHLAQVPPGQHGLHLHQYGRCEDAGQAAGSHYNPDGIQHGFLPDDGFEHAHAGDLGNIEIGEDGTGSLELIVPNLHLGGGRYSVGGRSVILHEKPDDFGQPLGNAGGRIGCGAIVITSE